jgi:hypothetical protein
MPNRHSQPGRGHQGAVQRAARHLRGPASAPRTPPGAQYPAAHQATQKPSFYHSRGWRPRPRAPHARVPPVLPWVNSPSRGRTWLREFWGTLTFKPGALAAPLPSSPPPRPAPAAGVVLQLAVDGEWDEVLAALDAGAAVDARDARWVLGCRRPRSTPAPSLPHRMTAFVQNVRVCARECVRACGRVCGQACMCVSSRGCTRVGAVVRGHRACMCDRACTCACLSRGYVARPPNVSGRVSLACLDRLAEPGARCCTTPRSMGTSLP